MPTDHRAKLATIKRFDQLIAYLRDEMGWPIGRDSLEDVDHLFYEFTADELAIDPKTPAKIQDIKRLRPLSPVWQWTFRPVPVRACTPSGEASAREKSSLKKGIAPLHPGSTAARRTARHTRRMTPAT